MIQTQKKTTILLDKEKTPQESHSIRLYWIGDCWCAYGISAYLLSLIAEKLIIEKLLYPKYKTALPITSLPDSELQKLIAENKIETTGSGMSIWVPHCEQKLKGRYTQWVEQIEKVEICF